MSQIASNGDIVTFTCNAVAFPAPSYSWSTPHPDNFTTSTVTFMASYSNFGNYTCMVTSNGITVESQPALLTGTVTSYLANVYLALYVCYLNAHYIGWHMNISWKNESTVLICVHTYTC